MARDLLAQAKNQRRAKQKPRVIRAKFLRVPNWKVMRAYNPETGGVSNWIKLHARWLDSYDFLQLSDAMKLQLILLWLFASRCGNLIPNDVEFLTWRLATDTPIDLEGLVARGFLEPAEADTTATGLSTEPGQSDAAASEEDAQMPRARAGEPGGPGAPESLGETEDPGVGGEKPGRLADAVQAAGLLRRFRIDRARELD